MTPIPKDTVKRRGPGRPRRIGPPTVAKKWHKVDWNQSDVAIGRKFGVTRQRVNQVRKIIGKKRTMPPAPSEVAEAWIRRNLRRVPTLTLNEAAEMAGVTGNAMQVAARRLRLRFRHNRKAAPWRSMPINWDLPSTDLQELWRLPSNTVANARSRGDAPRQKWHKRHDAASRAYQNALRREQEKAAKYWRAASGTTGSRGKKKTRRKR